MKNTLAKQLATAASKYVARYRDAGMPDSKVLQDDYDDLMSIAQMIESEESIAKIAKAMAHLDTAVRDEIPDRVYSSYCK